MTAKHLLNQYINAEDLIEMAWTQQDMVGVVAATQLRNLLGRLIWNAYNLPAANEVIVD